MFDAIPARAVTQFVAPQQETAEVSPDFPGFEYFAQATPLAKAIRLTPAAAPSTDFPGFEYFIA